MLDSVCFLGKLRRLDCLFDPIVEGLGTSECTLLRLSLRGNYAMQIRSSYDPPPKSKRFIVSSPRFGEVSMLQLTGVRQGLNCVFYL